MRFAFILSALLHIGLLAALSVRVNFSDHQTIPEAVVVDLVKIAPQTNLPQAKPKPKPQRPKQKPVKQTKKKPPAPKQNIVAAKEKPKPVESNAKDQLTVPEKKPKKMVKKVKKPTPPPAPTQNVTTSKIIPQRKPDNVPPPVINLEERYDDIFEALDNKLAETESKNNSNQAFNPELELTANERHIIGKIIDDQLNDRWHNLRGVLGADQIHVKISINVKENCKLGDSKILSISGAQTAHLRDVAKRRALDAIMSQDRITGLSDKQCQQLFQEKTIETTFGPDEEQQGEFYGRRTL
ncbi:MAG: hypothetical protein MK137_00130 [Rickettsiales bacterium]|nr:hypothetical protein [Rickettsiales bacterium]